MRSVPVVRINVVLAPKSCNFPEVAVVVEHFFPVSNFLDTSTRGTEMASLCLLCAWDLYTCSVVKPLMRPLCPIQDFDEYEISLPRVNEWHHNTHPPPGAGISRSVLWKGCALRVKVRAQKEGGPSWPRQRADGAFQCPGPLLYLVLK